VAGQPEGRTVQRDGAPRRISRPCSASGTEGLSSKGTDPFDPTAPARIDYLLGALRSSEPPGHIADQNAHGISPFRAFLPPSGAAPGVPGRCLLAVARNVHLRRFRRCAAASRLCSPLESGTRRGLLHPWQADALVGLCPSSATLPFVRGSRRINPPALRSRESRSRQATMGYRALPKQRIGWPLARLPTLMGFLTFSKNRDLRNRTSPGL
jgi:hypothetical protein